MSSRPVSKSESVSQIPEPSDGSAAEFSSNLGRALFQQRIEAALLATKVATRADGLAVSLRDGAVYVCRASVGCAPEIGVAVEPGQGICGRCIATAEAVVEQDLEGEIKSVAAVPVMKDGRISGFVAGFSLESNAFPPSTVHHFRELAASIHNEIDPPVEIRLNPESEEDEDNLLSQLGIVPDQAQPELPEGNEDDSFLSDLVLEVLGDVPSNGTAPKPMPPEEKAEPTPKAFVHRTTEDVLMEIVPPLHTPPQKTPLSAQAQQRSAGPAAAAKPALYPESIPDVGEEPSSKETSTMPAMEFPATAIPSFESEISTDSPAGWSISRMAAIVMVVLILAGLVSYFAFFRKSAPPKPQQVAATVPAPEVKPDAGAQPSQVQPAAGKQIQPGAGTESQAKTAKERRTKEVPLIVADSQFRTTIRGSDEAPPAAWNDAGGKIPAPVLPSATANVVFGGRRSSGAVPAKLIHRVEPIYPQVARSMHLAGAVRLELSVGSDGRVRAIKTLSGSEFLANAATEAVRKWRYEPAKQNGKNVESQVEVQVNFHQ